MKKIFILAYRGPFPEISGDRVRLAQFVRAFATSHEVILVSPEMDEDSLAVDKYKKVFKHWIRLEKNFSVIKFFLMLIKLYPIQVALFYSRYKVEKILNENVGVDDTVFFSLARTCSIGLCKKLSNHLVLDFCDALSLQCKRRSKKFSWIDYRKYAYIVEAMLLKRYEHLICGQIKSCSITTNEDKEYIGNSEISVISNCYDAISFFRTSKENHTIAITGDLSAVDNIEAICFFMDFVFSKIISVEPRCKVYIVGGNPPGEIIKKYIKYKNHVVYTGYVESIEKELATKCVYVCTLLAGTGIKTRILQAMGVGIPIVTTDWGNKGINAENDFHLLLRNDPDSIASSVLELFDNPNYAEIIGKNGRRFVEERFSINNFSDSVRRLIS